MILSRVDDALDKALAKEGIEAEDGPGGAKRDANGRFVKKNETTATADAGKDAPSVASSKHSDDDIRTATAALQRDKAPKWMLDKLTTGDDEAIAYALKRAKVQADGDEFTKKHKQLQQEFDKIKNQPAVTNGEGEGEGDATTSTAEPLAAYLAEMLGDDKAAEHVRASLAGLTKSQASELEKRDQQVAALQKQVEAMATERARDALVSEYPDLKDKEVWAKVVKAASSLPESEDRPDLQTRLEHAARIELAPELIRRAKAEQDRRNKVRDTGSPSAPSRTNETKSKATASDLQDAYLDAAERGDEGKMKEIKAALQARHRS